MDSRNLSGVAYSIGSAVFFGIMPAFIVFATKCGSNTISIIFFRFLLSLPFLLGYLIWRKVDLRLTVDEAVKILLLTVFGFYGTTFLLFSSFNYIATGLADTIHYIYPVLIIVSNVLFFHDKLNRVKLSCAAMCLIAMVLFNSGIGDFNLKGIMLAFGSGITYCFYNIFFEKSSISSMNGLKILFYGNIISAILSFTTAVCTDNLVYDIPFAGWICIVFLAVGATFIGSFFYQKGVILIGAQSAGILSTIEPVVTIIVGFLIYNERIGILGAVGCLLILVAAFIVAKLDS